ncbi:hypothetical protein CC1G_13040 [Coprinopsis cinerea okayama7|uniref:Uncharacterized protein n=1 Tax=Coprinopsis cinerea (strain Okayama-7 / 130 / ATCC MYA-4618 / FGSC 9003) TaxID=240176 RepID=A8N6Q9_COPC7|nr:hypothetical protein CC1G_13040 [Coprinopsis cinerea okayama7\|eukprot:XP_001830515.2 hypothetical protein CC1G_13040 [Coprinopsis cinerea okayama7\
MTRIGQAPDHLASTLHVFIAGVADYEKEPGFTSVLASGETSQGSFSSSKCQFRGF